MNPADGSKSWYKKVGYVLAGLVVAFSGKKAVYGNLINEERPAIVSKLEQKSESWEVFPVSEEIKRKGLDAIIVLGGGKIPYMDYSRAKAVADYIKSHGDNVFIIPSGGKGNWCKSLKESEAEMIKKELIRQGVSEGIIKTEPESSNTYQNFYFSKNIAYWLCGKKEGLQIGIVTHSSHMARALKLGRKAFSDDSSVDCKFYPIYMKHNDFKTIFSETVTLLYEGFRGIVKYFS